MAPKRQQDGINASVLIVSSNAETAARVHGYLAQVGFSASARATLNPLVGAISSIQALVVFPDDFLSHHVISYLSLVRSRRPDVTIVIVTGHPTAYATHEATNPEKLRTVVLVSPAFGWSIVDAIRAGRDLKSARP